MRVMDGAISYEVAAIIGGAGVTVGGLVAAVLTRYYAERSAIVAHVDKAMRESQVRWDAKFEEHRRAVNDAHKDIHDRIERVEHRAEDRLTKHIDLMRKEMNGLFKRVFEKLDGEGS